MNKRAAISSLMINVLLFLILALFVIFVIVFEGAAVVQEEINDRTLVTQVAVHSIIDSKCFFEEFGVFNQEHLNQEGCFVHWDDRVQSRIVIEYESTEKYWYTQQEEEFKKASTLCAYQTENLLCTTYSAPIIVRTQEQDYVGLLTIDTVVQ